MAQGNGSGKVGDGRTARWAGHRDRRRAEIVTAALAAINEHGPAVTTQQIARRAGIARPRLYRHFTDAEDLHAAIARSAAQRFVSEMAAVLTHPGGTPHDVITRIVRTFVTWMTDNAALYEYVVTRAAGPPEGGNAVIADARTTVSGMLRDLLGGYLVALDLDPGAADPLAFGLVGMVESVTQRWLVAPGRLDRDMLVTQVSLWVWGLLDHTLRASGAVLDPDQPLPSVPDGQP